MIRITCLVACMSALTACQPSQPDPRGVDRDETLLTVSASGRADTRPDEARLQLGVQSQAASAGEASLANRQKMDRVAAALSRLGVKPDDMQTRNLSLQRASTTARSAAGFEPTMLSRSASVKWPKLGTL